MALLSALSITQVSDLENEANSFQTHADDLHGLTTSMFELVGSTSNSWQGAAHDAFATKFDSLQDEMEYIYQQIVEYHDDLIQIASNYRTAEETNQGTANALSSDINLIKI